jgi:hypothetical protein
MEMVTHGDIWVTFDNAKTFNIKASYAAATSHYVVVRQSGDRP